MVYKKIKPVSSRRIKDNEKYKKVKAKKKEDMIEGGYYRCYFSNKPLDVNIDFPWHHVFGKRGKLLYEYTNIFPCIHEYHMQYHNMSADKLMKTDWYKKFLLRLKKINHKAYNKELNRLLKANVIDMESFLKEYI